MNETQYSHVHESPMVMLAPLYILAALSIFAGFLGLPHLLGNLLGHLPHQLNIYFANVLPIRDLPESAHGISEGLLMLLASIIAIGGIFFGLKKFQNVDPKKEVTGFGKVLENKYYIDEIYDYCIVKPLQKCAHFILQLIDNKIIQNTIAGFGCMIKETGEGLKKIQTGDIRTYGLLIMAGLVVMCILSLEFMS